MTQVVETSLPALLRERASLQPDDTAYTFIDYDQDWAGVPLSLTWPQLHRRVLNVARELSAVASPGDRVMLIAPQGLDYIFGFLGALQARVIPVPLSVPMGGVADERVESVLRDALPTAVLTTSSVVAEVARSISPQPGQAAPAIIEVDRLDLDAPVRASSADYEGSDSHDTAYLQYTSGSTRSPAGVMMSYTNLLTNLQQITSDFLIDFGGVAPPDLTFVSWLPFFHDLGLIMGVCSPVVLGTSAVLTSPVSFLQRPARWMQLAASYPRVFTSAPNFAFDVAAKKTSDDDMAGLDLSGVLTIQSGAERVQPVTIKRFTDRFARFNLRPTVIQPSYGLAEATLYLATPRPGQLTKVVKFDSEALSEGRAQRVDGDGGTPLISYGGPITPQSPTLRVVDPETGVECPDGTTGEIWAHGDNVSAGYWQKPEETERTFGGRIVEPSAGTPEGPWLKTGDLGFISEGELFMVGRLKDLLIVYGRNHAPDDIEATISEITGGRSAAIAIADDGVEQLAVILEVRTRGEAEDVKQQLATLKGEVTAAISNSHGLAVADLVLVSPGSIPITTSGKVRRSSCGDLYQRKAFARLDA
ncbi:long-chain-fatty-acid--AMP ligase FadD28 [Mycolicibacterium sarraceniae]|uniref:Long-chain-fatty-acid--AMP ligase FadD28 n=1 Tax=Mycolicibacterium sarraceniae TaxID=1534348 RepID=A0A7I7SS40_9MYCO|nr:long-chain-fatty-acid--AMP ligase FadD28 [Mycolicibacterium sarraceniae]